MLPSTHPLVVALDQEARRAHGIPGDEVAVRRAAAHAAVLARLAGAVDPAAVRVSVLGPAWSSDVDVHAHPPQGLLEDWPLLDPLLERLGSRGRGCRAVLVDGRPAGRLDLSDGPVPEPVDAVLSRCRRRREVRLRDALELVELADRHVLPAEDRVVAAAADLEAAAGGGRLQGWRTGAVVPVQDPVPLPSRTAGLRRVRRRLRRPRRLVVALSGVDGAGKSTLSRGLLADLEAVGVPAQLVWARPGMGLGWLSTLAEHVKGRTGQAREPGVRAAAAGDVPLPSSRRGAVGWLWTTAVTVSFLVSVHRRHRRTSGVVVYDRHLLDAVATLRVLYRGVDLRVPVWLVRHLLPRADVTVYLRLPADVAAARKPGDVIGGFAVAAQLEQYEAMLAGVPGVLVVDAVRPPEEILAVVRDRVFAA